MKRRERKRRHAIRHVSPIAATPQQLCSSPPIESAIASGSRDEGLLHAERAVSAALARDMRMKFLYFVPHQPQSFDEASPLGGFTPGLHSTASILLHAAQLPADIREPVTGQSFVLIPRLLRLVWPQIIPVELPALAAAQAHAPSPFQVTNDKTVAAAVDEIIGNARFPCLHISSIKGRNRIHPRLLDLPRLVSFVLSVLDALDGVSEWSAFSASARREIAGKPVRQLMSVRAP